jgi:Secretion system C-terminal sorting domain
MKKLLIFVLLISTFTSVSAQMLFSYTFAADTIDKPLNGHNGWSNVSRDSFPGIGGSISGEATVIKDTLGYPGFFTSLKGLNLAKADGVGHFMTTDNSLPNAFAPVYASGDKVYAAFLFKPSTSVSDSSNNSTGQIFRFYGKDRFNSDIVPMRLLIQKSGTKARFGIDKNLAAPSWTGFTYDLSKTHLIVMRYGYADSLRSANDTVALFVNPVASAIEPATPTAFTKAGDDAFLNLFVVYLNNPSIANNTSFGTLGALKIARRWSDLFTTSVVSDLKTVNLSIRPTLASNEITIELAEKDPSVSSLKIVDLSGRIVFMDKMAAGQTSKTLSVNGLAKGLYIVSIQNEKFVATQKFVKE